jgi:hypothetical protein
MSQGRAVEGCGKRAGVVFLMIPSGLRFDRHSRPANRFYELFAIEAEAILARIRVIPVDGAGCEEGCFDSVVTIASR